MTKSQTLLELLNCAMDGIKELSPKDTKMLFDYHLGYLTGLRSACLLLDPDDQEIVNAAIDDSKVYLEDKLTEAKNGVAL